MVDTTETFGSVIRTARHKLGLTAEQLGALIGLSKPGMIAIENSRTLTPEYRWPIIASVTGVPLEELRRLAALRPRKPRGPIKQDEGARFWSKADVRGPNECWPWLRSVDRCGYGKFQVGARSNDVAHRVAWRLVNGPVPEGLYVLHHCDNPPCVNPRHLYTGTQFDNMHDAVVRGRHVPPPRGEAHRTSKLTIAKVAEIRRRAASGETQTSLAGEFGVTQTAISSVVRRRTWKKEIS